MIILEQNNLTISRIYKYCVVRNFFKLTSSLIKIFIISLWIYYCGLYKISVSLRICKFVPDMIDHAYVSKYKNRELLLYSLRNHFLNAPIREKHPLAIFEYSVLVLLNRVVRSESDVYNIRDGVEFMSLAGMPRFSISKVESPWENPVLRFAREGWTKGSCDFPTFPFWDQTWVAGFYVNLIKQHFRGERGWLFTRWFEIARAQ